MPFLPVLSGKSCSPHTAPAKPGPRRVPPWPVTVCLWGGLLQGEGKGKRRGKCRWDQGQEARTVPSSLPRGLPLPRGDENPVLVGTRAMRKPGTGDADPRVTLITWAAGPGKPGVNDSQVPHGKTSVRPFYPPGDRADATQRTQVPVSFRIPRLQLIPGCPAHSGALPAGPPAPSEGPQDPSKMQS